MGNAHLNFTLNLQFLYVVCRLVNGEILRIYFQFHDLEFKLSPSIYLSEFSIGNFSDFITLKIGPQPFYWSVTCSKPVIPNMANHQFHLGCFLKIQTSRLNPRACFFTYFKPVIKINKQTNIF